MDDFGNTIVIRQEIVSAQQNWVDAKIADLIVCTDDYGNSQFRCRYTNVISHDVKLLGAIIPGVKNREVCANTVESMQLRKQSEQWFQESETNCNTCKHLTRVKMPKNVGWLYGKCHLKDTLQFHPDDPMPENVNCYKSRWSNDDE